MLIGIVLGTAFLLVQLEVGEAHWRHCFEGMVTRSLAQGDSSYALIDTWVIALNALMRPSREDLMFVAAPMLPALAVVALARRPWMAFIALVPMLFVLWLALDPGNMHDCDRKGCNGCLAVAIFMLLLQLPISTLVLIGVGLDRLWSRAPREA